jgi:hypothetical protein
MHQERKAAVQVIQMTRRIRFGLLVPLAMVMSLTGGIASASAAPSNDNFATPQMLSGALPVTASGNNSGATAEAGEPAIYSNAVTRSVWYRWTAPANAAAVIDQCEDGFTGSDNPPLMAVRTGSVLAAQTLISETSGRCLLRFTAVAGTTYNIQIDYHSEEGAFNLKIRPQAAPSNDNFAGATPLADTLPVNQAGTTVDSTWQAGEPASLGGSSSSRSVWYSWTSTVTGRIRMSLCDTTFVDGPLNNQVIAYTGATLAGLAEVAKLTSTDCNVDFPVIAGTNYKIAVSGDIKGEFNFVLSLKAATPPANDNFADAQAIGPGLPLKLNADNDYATVESGEPDHGDYSGTTRSLWYSWTADRTARVRLRACGEGKTFFTSVYTGASLPALTEVGDRSYASFCSIFFDAVAGTKYMIAVAGGPFTDNHGPFQLDLHQLKAPVNDSFEKAVNLGSKLPVSVPGTTVDGSDEPDEPNHSDYMSERSASVWYRWKAVSDKPVILSSCGSGNPNRISVYDTYPDTEETGLRALRMVDNDDHSCTGKSMGGRLAIAPEKGTVYMIAVSAARSEAESAFTLKINGFESKGNSNAARLKKAIAKCKKLKGKKKRSRCIKAAKKRFKK